MGRKANSIAVGMKFNRLLVIEFSHFNKWKNRMWRCQCDCGVISIVCEGDLKNGGTKSCGCLQREIAKENAQKRADRGKRSSNFSTYVSWQMMKNRCYNKNDPKFKLWGGRGIKVCDRWLESFENFFEDMGSRPVGKAWIVKITMVIMNQIIADGRLK